MARNNDLGIMMAIIMIFAFGSLFMVVGVVLYFHDDDLSASVRDFCIENGYSGVSLKDFNYHSGYCYNSKHQKRHFAMYKDGWRFEE